MFLLQHLCSRNRGGVSCYRFLPQNNKYHLAEGRKGHAYEDVELREMLPNQDGSFQKRSILKVSAEKLQKHNYTCVIEHSSMEKEMVLEVPIGSNKLQTYIMKEDLLV
ncbi:hypothetical protein HF521_014948 [Silurus meridionalis]|uniref:Immunoglobulin C1-set domain-containing protein n=1 Tax=Silurus meridionalis TaxID=175797 RepID=A0A8T0AB81_SILME|nr:hypothetical protein HF521_014948 [Silurus meridionalis]